MVRKIAGPLGRDEGGVECALLSRDAVSRDMFVPLLPKMHRLQAQGGDGEAVCKEWMLILGSLLTSKEREAYGIASP